MCTIFFSTSLALDRFCTCADRFAVFFCFTTDGDHGTKLVPEHFGACVNYFMLKYFFKFPWRWCKALWRTLFDIWTYLQSKFNNFIVRGSINHTPSPPQKTKYLQFNNIRQRKILVSLTCMHGKYGYIHTYIIQSIDKCNIIGDLQKHFFLNSDFLFCSL